MTPELDDDRFEAICNASPDAILLVDADGSIAFANRRISDILGYEPAELVGDHVDRLVPAEARPGHAALVSEYVADPEPRAMGADLDLEAVAKDGTRVPVDIALSPIETGGEAGVVAVVREVTNQLALERKYQRILEAVPDPVVVADAETGEILEANERAGALFGYDPSALVGMNQMALHPSGEAERYRGLFEHHVGAEQEIVTHLPDGSNVLIETAEGEHVPVEINAHVFEDGDHRRIAGVFRDLRRRRSHARALRELHSATRQLMAATDRETVATLASETASSVLGLDLNGVHFYDEVTDQLVPVAWSDAVESIFEGAPPSIPAREGLAGEAYQSGEPASYDDVREAAGVLDEETPFRSELYLPLGDFGVCIVGSTAVDDFDSTDEALARVLAANVEAALGRVEREERLRSQNERLEEFTSVVSHDLRNPLNVAMGSLELAQEDVESEHLATVARAHDRMGELIDDLLALAKQGQGLDELDSVDLADVVERCWRHVETAAATLHVDTDRTILADESRVRQLLENLFRNAVVHGAGADGRVTVTVGDLQGGFFVADDGPGISPDDREHLFEMGFTTETDGTGFGLAIVETVAEGHGWTVSVAESEAGGVRFVFDGADVRHGPRRTVSEH